MSRQPTVFISYNPHNAFEETLAIRLHTIGSVHGYNMLLPDRYYDDSSVSAETRNRIQIADYFLVFSTSPVSNVVQEEIALAFGKLREPSKIMVIYDARNGKNLSGTENCTELYIDPSKSIHDTLNQILGTLNSLGARKTPKKTGSPVAENDLVMGLGALLLAGLGLFMLGSAKSR